MSDVMKARVKKNFNSAARTYAQHASVQQKSAQHLMAFLQKQTIRLPTRIADVGCGTGFMTTHLLSRYPKADYWLIDLAPEMVAMCRGQFTQYAQQIQYEVADAECAVFAGGPFDCLVSNLTVQWFSHLWNGLAHLKKQSSCCALSTLVDGTFAMVQQAYATAQVPSPLHVYPAAADVMAYVRSLSPAAVFSLQTETVCFVEARDFFRHLQHIGAHTPACQSDVGALRAMMRRFPEGIAATYQILHMVF